MSRYTMAGLASVGAAAALALAACGGGSSTTTGGGGSTGATGYNAAVNNVVQPSAKKGGTIIFDNSSGPDSADAGNTYYAFNLNFSRLYATPLTTYKRCPGYTCGATVVPGLATALGTSSEGGKVWTYHLKPGVKYEDGSPVTSQDRKSTRLNSSHLGISYAVFCLKK